MPSISKRVRSVRRAPVNLQRQREGGEKLLVKEAFYTIQGEGPMSGVPAVFVRMAGCNLKCWFCDTDFEGGIEWNASALVAEVKALRASQIASAVNLPHEYGDARPLAVITGGEPMMQPIGLLVTSLLGNRWRVQIETDGTLWTDLPDSDDLEIVCSPKLPKVHPTLRPRVTAWKYLIRTGDQWDRADGLPMSNTQDKERAGGNTPIDQPPQPLAKPTRNRPVFLQPVEEVGEGGPYNNGNTQTAVRRAMAYGYSISLQQHKILGLR